MEACLALALSLEVDLHTTESLDEGQNDKISSFISRMRAAQTQLLEVRSLRSAEFLLVSAWRARASCGCNRVAY